MPFMAVSEACIGEKSIQLFYLLKSLALELSEIVPGRNLSREHAGEFIREFSFLFRIPCLALDV